MLEGMPLSLALGETGKECSPGCRRRRHPARLRLPHPRDYHPGSDQSRPPRSPSPKLRPLLPWIAVVGVGGVVDDGEQEVGGRGSRRKRVNRQGAGARLFKRVF